MNTLPAALAVAAEGYAVFPCFYNKHPCIKDWPRRASRDPAVVRQWNWRDCLVGVPTGEVNGFAVIDIDPAKGGDAWLFCHLERLPDTRIHSTRSGGVHLLFRYSAGLRNSASKIALGWMSWSRRLHRVVAL